MKLSFPRLAAGEHTLSFAVGRKGPLRPVEVPPSEGRIRVTDFPTVQTIEIDLPGAVLGRALELADGG